MNFFGHALVATHKRPNPVFVLGSMLPDLASMLRLRVPEARDAELSDGVEFHHATDHAFHESESFRALNLEASRQLTELGIRRGTVRAVAHIGVEYLIDAELAVLLRQGIPQYQAALAEGQTLGASIGWTHPSDEERFARLCANLTSVGVNAFSASADNLVRRLERALFNRPRLTIWEKDLPRVERWARSVSGHVAATIPTLLSELSFVLDVRLGGEIPPTSGP